MHLNDENRKIIVFSPHCDDGELGCGASIAKFVENGDEVHYIAFSDARTTLPDNLEPDTLRKETIEATSVLGIDSSNVKIFDIQTRHFPEHRQKILDIIIKLRDEIKPDLIFTPSLKDVHQDHQTVSNEVMRAFKKGDYTIFGYEEPWNCFTFDTVGFICMDKKFIDKKVEALLAYKSQSHRDYLDRDFIEGLAKTRGVQIGHEYAEAFEILRLVLR